ncbi:unnamed protein product [Angiostrongylus costaricensis]|uniref:DB domain-containing protein n=1 Tax=Angiostrongylus costaricensis TaxID=334426 RepID=A0A0R3PY04_ANGCS|nr:unnamed protein product [Angiostrongylus costaricensis]
MKTIWFLIAVLSLSTADLPSCKRARCSHCSLEFISKACQKTCQDCPRVVLDKVTGKKLKVYPEDYHPLPISSSYKTKKDHSDENEPQKPLKQPDIGVISRQSGVATQTQQQFNSNAKNKALQPVHRPVLQGHLPPNQFNQLSVDISTLAPLIPPPRPTDINRNLAQQPADLAHSLTDYQQSAQNVEVFKQQQPTAFQNAAQPQLYSTNQNTFTQPAMTDIFGRPMFQAQAVQPLQFPQQQQPSLFMNSFQTFPQQPSNQQSMLDPLGLLNLAGMTHLGQGTTVGQTPAISGSYSQPQITYGIAPITSHQPLVNPQQNFQQSPQANYYGQQQNYYNNQHPNAHQSVQNYYQGAAPQHVTSSLTTGDVYSAQYNRNHLQQGARSQQVSNGLSKPLASPSIDAAPINVQKYVDGKGVVQTNSPQQCPRQPGWAPCITKQTANERFVNCCARLGEGCLPLCNYDAQLATVRQASL